MKHEFYAQYKVTTREKIEDIIKRRRPFDSFDVPTQISLLAQAMVMEKKEKSFAQTGLKRLVHDSDKYNAHIQNMHTQFLTPLHLLTPLPERSVLPDYSFLVSFLFTLAKPYLSKDDESFYIIDNPLKKEKIFKVPYIAPSSWKGNLRWVMMRKMLGEWWESLDETGQEARQNIRTFAQRRFQLTLLFGNENKAYQEYLDRLSEKAVEEYQSLLKPKTSKEGLLSGRLYFYPTYLNAMNLDVINPHDRKTKAGKLPIYYEIAPEGAQGTFSLLYVPFDQIGQAEDDMKAQTFEYLDCVYNGLQAMFLDYGFSAKKTSGYGVIEETFPDKDQTALWVKGVPIFRKKDSQEKRQPMSQMADWKQQLYQMKVHSDNEDTMFSSFQEMEQLIKRIKKEAGVNV